MSIDRASEEFKARAQALVDKERDTIDEYGFTARHVFGQGSPGFSYTMGVSRIDGAPEVIAFGLPAEVAHALCWSFFEKVKTGWVPKDWEVSDEMANMPVTFRYLTDEAIEEHAHGTVLDAASAEIERQNREKAEKQRRAQEIANRCACW